MSFSKHGTVLLIETRISACAFKQFLDFVLIVKRVLNLDWQRYCMLLQMEWVQLVSQNRGNMTIAGYQYSSNVLFSNCISRAPFERSSYKILFQLFITWHFTQIEGIWIHNPFFKSFHLTYVEISIKWRWQHFQMSHNFFTNIRNRTRRFIFIDNFFKWWKFRTILFSFADITETTYLWTHWDFHSNSKRA